MKWLKKFDLIYQEIDDLIAQLYQIERKVGPQITEKQYKENTSYISELEDLQEKWGEYNKLCRLNLYNESRKILKKINKNVKKYSNNK